MPSIPVQFSDDEWVFLLQNRGFSERVLNALKNGKGALSQVVVMLDVNDAAEVASYVAMVMTHTKNPSDRHKFGQILDNIDAAFDYTQDTPAPPQHSPVNQGLKDMLESQEFASKEDMDKAVQDYQDTYNNTPQDELCGFSPNQTSQMLNSQMDMPDCALKLNHDLTLKDLAAIPFFQNARTFLRLMEEAEEVKATKKLGNLNRKFVEQLLEASIIDNQEWEMMHRHNKVINEEDYLEGHIIRLVYEIAGLIKKRKDVFSITKKGSQYRTDRYACALFTSIFQAHFCKLNLGYMDGYPDFPGIQQTLTFSLAAIKQKPDKWMKFADFTKDVLLTAVTDNILYQNPSEDMARLCDTRILRHLKRFGLLEAEFHAEHKYWSDPERYRKTPLFDKFIRLEFQ